MGDQGAVSTFQKLQAWKSAGRRLRQMGGMLPDISALMTAFDKILAAFNIHNPVSQNPPKTVGDHFHPPKTVGEITHHFHQPFLKLVFGGGSQKNGGWRGWVGGGKAVLPQVMLTHTSHQI